MTTHNNHFSRPNLAPRQLLGSGIYVTEMFMMALGVGAWAAVFSLFVAAVTRR